MSNPINNQQNPYSTPTDSYAPTSGTNTMPSNTTQPNPYISNPTATTMGSNEPPAYTAAANTTAATTGKTTGEKAKGLAHTIKHGITAVHGIGEEARGRFNGAIDGAFHDVRIPSIQRWEQRKTHEGFTNTICVF